MESRLERWSRKRLIARIHELEAERAASQMLPNPHAPDGDAARLTPREREAVAVLVGREYVPSDELARALFGRDALIATASEGIKNDDRHSARMYLWRANQKLARVGWRVSRRLGYGYRLEECG